METFPEKTELSFCSPEKILRSDKCEDRCLDGPAAEELPVQKSEEMKSLDRKEDALKELYNKCIGPVADLLHGDEIIIVPWHWFVFPQSSPKISSTFLKPSGFD